MAKYDEYEELASELAESLVRMFADHQHRVQGITKKGKTRFEHTMMVNREIEGRPFEFELEIMLGFSSKFKTVVGQGYAIAGEEDDDYVEDDKIEIQVVVNPALKRAYEILELTVFHFLVHEMEHLVHGDGINRITDRHVKEDPKVRSMINMGLIPPYLYKLLPREIVSGVKEMMAKAKATGLSFEQVLEDELDDAEITNKEERDEVRAAYKAHLSKNQ